MHELASPQRIVFRHMHMQRNLVVPMWSEGEVFDLVERLRRANADGVAPLEEDLLALQHGDATLQAKQQRDGERSKPRTHGPMAGPDAGFAQPGCRGVSRARSDDGRLSRSSASVATRLSRRTVLREPATRDCPAPTTGERRRAHFSESCERAARLVRRPFRRRPQPFRTTCRDGLPRRTLSPS